MICLVVQWNMWQPCLIMLLFQPLLKMDILVTLLLIEKLLDINENTKYTSNKTNKYGDATYETSSASEGANSWNGDSANFPNTTNPWFIRGGTASFGTFAGVLNFNRAFGLANSEYSFRVVVLGE